MVVDINMVVAISSQIPIVVVADINIVLIFIKLMLIVAVVMVMVVVSIMVLASITTVILFDFYSFFCVILNYVLYYNQIYLSSLKWID